jgi:succinoglycan biosynthesis protein ExoM
MQYECNTKFASVFGAVYVHEPRCGLVYARNAAVEAALALDADFVAATNDDCEPDENWLGALMDIQRRTRADVVRGGIVYA